MVPLPNPMVPETKREELNEIFVGFLGTRNAYFQPDANVKMVYPAIVYEMDYQDTIFAGNSPYRRMDRYQVTAIDWDPDVPVSREIEKLPMCVFVRSFVSEGLNQRIYSLYF